MKYSDFKQVKMMKDTYYHQQFQKKNFVKYLNKRDSKYL